MSSSSSPAPRASSEDGSKCPPALRAASAPFRFPAEIEEQARRGGVFKRAAVAVQPRREDHAAGARSHLRHGVGHIVVEALVDRLAALGHVGLRKIHVHLVEHEVILHPFKAFARRFHLGKIVVFSRLRPDDARHHRGDVDGLMIHHRPDPAGRAGVDVRLADLGRARTDADERRVAAAAIDGRSFAEAKLRRGLRGERPGDVAALDDARQVPRFDAVHLAKRLIPVLTAGPRVVEERGIGRVARHDEFTRAARDQIFLHVQPFVRLLEDLWLVRLHPLVFPERIFHARRRGMRRGQTAEHHPRRSRRRRQSVRLTRAEFRARALIHIAHRAAERVRMFIDEHHALHL